MGSHSKYPSKAGIYKLTCSVNGKVYIGKSTSLNRRLNVYKNYKETSRAKGHLKNSIVKYGWDSFNVEILEIFNNIDNNLLLERESYFIELFDSTNLEKGYNLCKYSNDATGHKHSEETKEKMRQRMLGNTINNGRVQSEETKNKIRQGNLGKTIFQETKDKQKQGRLGKKHSAESIEKMKQVKLLMWEVRRQKSKTKQIEIN